MQRQTQNLHLLQGGSPPARWPANFVFVSAYLILFWFYFDYFDFILIILIIFWFILHFVHGWHMCFDYFVDYLFDLFFGNSWNNQIWPDGCAGSLNYNKIGCSWAETCSKFRRNLYGVVSLWLCRRSRPAGWALPLLRFSQQRPASGTTSPAQ